jgi:hypothetical protein
VVWTAEDERQGLLAAPTLEVRVEMLMGVLKHQQAALKLAQKISAQVRAPRHTAAAAAAAAASAPPR